MWHWEKGPKPQIQQVDPRQRIVAFFFFHIFSCTGVNRLEEIFFLLAKGRTQVTPWLGVGEERQVVVPLSSLDMCISIAIKTQLDKLGGGIS